MNSIMHIFAKYIVCLKIKQKVCYCTFYISHFNIQQVTVFHVHLLEMIFISHSISYLWSAFGIQITAIKHDLSLWKSNCFQACDEFAEWAVLEIRKRVKVFSMK